MFEISRFKEKEKKNVNNKILPSIAILVIIGIIAGLVFMFNNSQNKKPSTKGTADKAMTALVTTYYEEKIKGNVFGVNQQKVTLQALEEAGYDISSVIDKGEYDKTKTYSLVKIENPNETDVDKIKYTVENHLDGI